MNKRNTMRNGLGMFVTTALVALVLTAGTPTYAQQRQSHLGGRPSDLLTLGASDVRPGTSRALQLITPDGRFGGAFELPPHTVLIVTDLIVEANVVGILPFPCSHVGRCWLQVVILIIRALRST